MAGAWLGVAADAGAAAVVVARVDVVLVVAARAVDGAGLAAAVRVVCVTVRVLTVAVLAGVSAATGVSTLVSAVTEEVSAVTGGAVVVTGTGSVGCTSCASEGVEESARAAAIAGRALVRA